MNMNLTNAELAAEVRTTTELMANFASVGFDLWNRHSNACLEAASRLTALQPEDQRL